MVSSDWISWDNGGACWYAKTATGIVHLRVAVKGNTMLTSDKKDVEIGVLPVGFRPTSTVVAVGYSTSTDIHVGLMITNAGSVLLRRPSSDQFKYQYANVDALFWAAN